jgi:NAD(P)-dependent dehydrogenase (short-subunit alcohol dehydrogenase family)
VTAGTEKRRIMVTGVGGSIGTAIMARLEAAGGELIRLSQRGLASEGIIVDFADDEEVVKAIAAVPAPVNGVVAAHGMLLPGPFARVTPREWRAVLDANLNSIYVILHSVLSKLSRPAAIVVISSTAALDHSPVGGPHYTASKWALNGLVRHLAAELGPRGIRINSVCPGLVDNSMGHAFISEAEFQANVAGIPLKRPGTPAEMASVVNFLLSEEASYVTGALVPVAGGYR